jgi:predicted transcriptional regulator
MGELTSAIVIHVSPELKAELTALAETEGHTLSSITRKALRDYVRAKQTPWYEK